VLGGLWSIDALIDEAAAVPAGAGGLVFLPYLAGERSPIWDERASGAFVGLRLDHGRGHLVRAVLEASAFAVRHVAAPIVEAGIAVADLRLAGRPATNRTWAQIKSDVSDLPVLLPRTPETSVLGAAMLAAVGAGLMSNLTEAVERMASTATRLEPRPETRATYDRAYDVYRRLYPNLREAMHELAGEQPGRSG
jgi:xylulokinase